MHAKQSKRSRKRKHKIQSAEGEDLDFEKVYGKDIEQFLDDSEWDIDSFDKVSLSDGGDGKNEPMAGRMTEVMTLEQAFLKGQAQQ